MNSPHRLERHFSWIAISGLIRYVVLVNALVFLLHLFAPGYESMLTLNREAILHGEIWRLFTWIFIPETMRPFWVFFALLFLWFLGEGLEESIGAFRTTLFYFSGMIGCTVVALIFGSYGANTFLNLSLLYAFATMHPDYKVLFLFVIPMRIGWLALLSAILTAIGSLAQSSAVQAALIITLLNYLLFFWPMLFAKWKNKKLSFPKKESILPEALHHCATCHRTEQTNPELHFRVTTHGEEYCMEHLPRK
jgi:membrane associated rhomboid family serine protease